MVEKETNAQPRLPEVEDSPVPHSPPRGSDSGGKERRLPSITPRKFKRFFTPRDRVPTHPSTARRALRNLTATALNRSSTPSSPLKTLVEADGDIFASETPRVAKRRKFRHTPDPSSPLKPSSDLALTASAPLAVASSLLSPIDSPHSSRAPLDLAESDDDVSDSEEVGGEPAPSKRIVPLIQKGLAGHLLQRQLGVMPSAGRRFMSFPVADWRMETADFCTTPDDVHRCSSHEGSPRCIPFCVASCHNNSIVAVGDEEGVVRLLDSASSGSDASSEEGVSRPKEFNKIQLWFQAHGNAIIDLAFSEDDYRLATASGDQTGRVMDVMRQTPVAVLDQHSASLKQVRFQPGKGGGHVLATSGRDGNIRIWDLRCRGGLVQDFTINRSAGIQFSLPRKISQGCVVNSMSGAHARTLHQARQQAAATASTDVATRNEVPGRLGEVSVTALQFLPAGREHLILSACEADANVKLWDIRNVHQSRQRASTPLSITSEPASHHNHRPFGMSSMSLSTDGARLYTVCKDNTVYAYATSHLVMGHAPELSSRGDTPKRRNGTASEGLGPLYGFRHDSFHVTSFYVKSAIRPARDGCSELLAVGSSDGCAIVFPTDERYLDTRYQAPTADLDQFAGPPVLTLPAARGARPALSRTNSISNLNARLKDTIPIHGTGTPLTRGHTKEVGALAWTSQGKLVTVGDDYLIRCWAEDRNHAADLRTHGEGGGRRWASGWADVGDDWDEDRD